MENAVRSVPRIYAALDNKQADHQSNMIEIEGMLNDQVVSVLIDSGANHSYIDPRVVDKCCLSRSKHDHSWLVQLATGTKKRIIELV